MKGRLVLSLLIVAAVAVAGTDAFAAGRARLGRSHRPADGGFTSRQLLKVADAIAAENGDHHPYDIEAVRTTRGAAGGVIWPGPGVDLDPTRVYVITMRGKFMAYNASTPLDGDLLTGTVISSVIGATGRLRGQGLDANLTKRPEPDLAKLGKIQ
ncbi:MAG TPA: hypothetical protein VG365_00140 [Solirubrobacteraceae bacterium]|nr:hypothetical protein [Solirubrobacteraceae bacterium]